MSDTPDHDLYQHHHEIANILSIIISRWADLEVQMCKILSALLNGDPAATMAVFYTVSANKVRRDILLNVSRVKLKNHPDELRKMEKLARRIQRAAKKRNDLMHSVWTVQLSTGDANIFRFNDPPGFFSNETITLDYLRRTAQQLKALSEDLITFDQNVRVLLDASPYTTWP